MPGRRIELKDIQTLKFVGLPVLDPSGKRFFYPVKEIVSSENGKELKYSTEIWCYEFEGDRNYPFTNSSGTAANPKVSGDGRTLAYLVTSKKCPLRLLPLNGGESRSAWKGRDNFEISSYCWSPDSNFIALSMRLGRNTKRKKRFEFIRNLYYKADGTGIIDSENRFGLWLFDARNGSLKELYSDRFDNNSPVWSPDGKKILFSSNKMKFPDYNLEHTDFYLYDMEAGNISRLTGEYGSKSNASFSPDGSRVAFLGNTGNRSEVKHRNIHLRVMEVEGDGKSTDLLEKKPELYVQDYVIGDMKGLGEDDPTPLWIDDEDVLFIASYQGSCNLYSAGVRSGQVRQVESGRWELASFTGNPDKLLCLISDAVHPAEIFLYESGNFRKLTGHNRFLSEEICLSSPEEHWIETESGNRIQGWVMKPPDFDPGVRYPAVMEVHGGPGVLYGWSFFFEFHLLAAAGYVVFYVNPRGSQGYGEEFCNSIIGNWGGVDWHDIRTSAEHFIRHDYIDEERVGITGGSYGGYMTNWAIGHTDMFKAAVTQRSVSNCHNFFGTSDAGFYFIDEVAFGKPWEDPMNYMKVSPLSYVGKVNTPLLIIHCEGDQRTPVEQAEQLFTALKLLRKKCAFLRFSGESHDLSRTGAPENRMIRLAHMVLWFNRYLKNPFKSREMQAVLEKFS